MLDLINSLAKEDLVNLGKKHKILGHLSATNPYLSEDELRLAIIKKIEDEIQKNRENERKRRSKKINQ